MEKYAKKTKNNKSFKNKNALDQEIVRVATKILKKEQEKKSFDTGFGSTVASTGTLQKLSTIPQGDTDSTRDGDVLRTTQIDLIGSVVFADASNVIRLTIVRWNQDDSSAAPASVTDLFQTATPYSPYNRDNLRAKKFTVVTDHFYGVGATGPNIKTFEMKRKFQTNINFQSGANTGTGHLYAFMLTDSTGIPHPALNYVCRVWYTDS
jgi:hypothetical protein